MTLLTKKILEHIGVNPERLRLEWVSASQGIRFAEVMNDVSNKLKELGPLGKAEGVDENALKFRLDSVMSLMPYLKLVERERLRVRFDTEEEYRKFFSSAEFEKLFQELIGDKLEMTQMMTLLREKPRTTGEISEILGLSPSKISRHLNASARQGLGIFDEKQNLITAAPVERAGAKKTKKSTKKTGTKSLVDAKIDKIINKHQGSPGSLIHVLMELQHENHWLPRGALEKVSGKLGVPLSEILHVATFYKTFSLKPQGRHEVHVCAGTSCHKRGSAKILEKVQDVIGIKPGETTSDLRFSLENGSCLGCCTLGPEIVVDGVHHSNITPDDVEDILKDYK